MRERSRSLRRRSRRFDPTMEGVVGARARYFDVLALGFDPTMEGVVV